MAQAEIVAEKLFDANVRIEGIWPIPNCETPSAMLEAFEYRESLPPELEPFAKGWSADELEQLFAGDEADAREAWSELFSNLFFYHKQLYAVQASCPVYTRTSETTASFSWGHYSSDIFVAETPEQAMEAAVAWGEAEYANAKVSA